MALKEADKPQIVTPMEKSDADGPVTIELPPEEGEQSAALVAEHEARHRSVSNSPKPAAEQQRQQAIMLHCYQQQQKLAEARREQRQAEYDSSLTRWQPNTAMPNRRRTTMRLPCGAVRSGCSPKHCIGHVASWRDAGDAADLAEEETRRIATVANLQRQNWHRSKM
jgi:hypothetical protein